MPDSAAPEPPKLSDKIPAGEKLAFGFGCLFRAPGLHALNQLAYPIFNVAFGLNPAWIGLTLGLFRLWDAFTDPLMGVISDNHRGRFGRRKPFIFVGAILAASLFPIVFWVPAGWGQMGIFAYFLLTSLAYYTAFTVFATPLWAIAFERTADYNERTSLWAVNSFFATIGFAGIGWVYPLTQIDYWENTVQGVRYVSIGIGIFWIFCGIVPAIFMKERFRHAVAGQPRIRLFRGIRETLKNKPFVLLNGIQLAILIGTTLVEFLGFYLNVYYVHGGETKPASVIMGIGATVGLIVRASVVPLIPLLSSRLGKRGLLVWTLFAFSLVSVLKWVLITPSAPMLQVLVIGADAIPIVIFWTMMPSMVSDTCDWDERQTGQRREGLFSSVDQWINKCGSALGSGATGLILVMTGFDSALGGGQSDGTLLAMRILYSVTPIAFFGLALWMTAKYPITNQTAAAVRAELESRRGAV